MKRVSHIIIVIILFITFSIPAFAVDLELNTKQDLIIPASGFYRFSDSANDEIKSLLKENKSVAIIITTFNGGKLRVAPAADNHETGKKKTISGPTSLALGFKSGGKRYGLSFVPKGSTTIGIEIQPFAGRPCQAPVSCQDSCGDNLGKCCEKDANGNQSKICVSVGTSSCGCGKR